MHKNVSLKEIILYPQGCQTIIELGDFILHKQKCINSVIDCPFNIIGFTDKFQKKLEEEKLSQDLTFIIINR